MKKSKASTRSFKEYTLKGKTLSGLEHYRSSIFKQKREISGNLYEAVQVPEDVFKDSLEKIKSQQPHLTPEQAKVVAKEEAKLEWISINTVELLNIVMVHYASVEEFHAKTFSEPGKGFPDGCQYKFPQKQVTPAFKYVADVLEWASTMIEDPNVFPEMEDDEFPADFIDKHMTELYKRLNRVYAIMFAKCAPALLQLPNLSEIKHDFEKFYYFMCYFEIHFEDREWKAFDNPTSKQFVQAAKLKKSYEADKAKFLEKQKS